jgi:hypothetical protein
VDGTDQTESSGIRADFANQNTLLLGRFADGLFSFRGRLDEARIESVARSANWIWASWMTVASNAIFGNYSAVTRQLPRLAANVHESTVTLKWPGSGVGFAMFTTTNLTPPIG